MCLRLKRRSTENNVVRPKTWSFRDLVLCGHRFQMKSEVNRSMIVNNNDAERMKTFSRRQKLDTTVKKQELKNPTQQEKNDWENHCYRESQS